MHTVETAIEAIEVKLAQQQVDINTAHEIYVDDHVVTQIALHPDIHVIAALHRVIFGIKLRRCFVKLNVAHRQIIEVFRRKCRSDRPNLLFDDLLILANRQVDDFA